MYQETDLVRIAKRENNKKRTYLVVNRLQGKHVPVKPQRALEMFEKLADTIKEEYSDEKLLLVGFAETATAIGAAAAIRLGSKYIQTTREVIPGVEYLFFSEAHSHATEQKLVKDDIDQVIGLVDRMIFVEDEVTTGNTILNIVDIIEKNYPGKVRFSVASILNGMDEAALEKYNHRGIRVHYLVKTDHSQYAKIAEKQVEDGSCFLPDLSDAAGLYCEKRVSGWMDARRIVDAQKYDRSCRNLWEEIEQHCRFTPGEKVLVVGTEEFMYPALFVASNIEKKGAEVRCHSTTRSPIAVCKEESYPLHCRYELRSLYDKNRKTFLYDLAPYDEVIIITDSQDHDKEGINSVIHAIRRSGSQRIQQIRWCKEKD